MKKALLLIDIQNDYFPGGSMELSGSDAAVMKAGLLLRAFRAKSLPIVHIQHIASRPGATFFLPGTPGAEIHSCLQPQDGEAVFTKSLPNSFKNTPLLEHLRQLGITDLAIAGMMTHMCVDTTTRAARDLDFTCTLAHDACATRDLSFNGNTVAAKDVQTAYMAALNGLFAIVLPTEEVCASL